MVVCTFKLEIDMGMDSDGMQRYWCALRRAESSGRPYDAPKESKVLRRLFAAAVHGLEEAVEGARDLLRSRTVLNVSAARMRAQLREPVVVDVIPPPLERWRDRSNLRGMDSYIYKSMGS